MWATTDYADCLALTDKALLSIQHEYEAGEVLALRAWGSLQLRAAVSAARAGNAAETEARIDLACIAAERDAAAEGEVFDRHSLTFSRGNVAVHAMSVQVEMTNFSAALQLHQRANPQTIAALPNSRRGHHQLDLSRAWLGDGNRAEALAALEQAERTAPQLIRNHPVARATLRKLVTAERASTREKLRRMSDRFHLDG